MRAWQSRLKMPSKTRSRGPRAGYRWGLSPICELGLKGRRWLSYLGLLTDAEKVARVKAYVWERAGRSRWASLDYDSDLDWLLDD